MGRVVVVVDVIDVVIVVVVVVVVVVAVAAAAVVVVVVVDDVVIVVVVVASLVAPIVTTAYVNRSFNKIQNGDILVPANPDPPGKRFMQQTVSPRQPYLNSNSSDGLCELAVCLLKCY